MGVDLNGLVSRYLNPQRVGQIASTAGVDPDVAQKLVGGAVPAVLASLSGALAAPGGAQRIYDAVANADPDTLGKLSAALGAGQLQALTDGANALGGLIGANALTSLANALAQYVGVPAEAAQPALGAVGQAVIGVIGQQDPSNWSDPNALANVFAAQRGAIAAALPSALSHLLGAAAAAASPAPASAPPAPSSPSPAPSAARGPSFPIWAIVLVVVIALAALAYWYVHHRKAEKPTAALAPATIELTALPGDSVFG